MPLKQHEIKPGDPIKAQLFNDMLGEINRVSKLTVSAPLTMLNGPTGIHLGLADAGREVAIVRFERWQGFTYPQWNNQCVFFPAAIYPQVKYVPDGQCNVTADVGDKGEQIMVYNIREGYIPENTWWVAYRINGFWWCDFIRWKLKGKLKTKMVEGQSVTMDVWSSVDTGEDLVVYDWLLKSGQTIAANVKVTAFYDLSERRFYVDAAQCG